MDTDQNKSVSVDYETWQLLTKWAERECRAVSGQIRYLTKRYGPRDLLQEPPEQPLSLPPPAAPQQIVTKLSNEWQTRSLKQTRFQLKPTQRMALLQLILEYGEPITNSELLILAQNHENVLLSKLDVAGVSKNTSTMWSQGLLMRRKLQFAAENGSRGGVPSDRFEYVPHPRTKKMIIKHEKRIREEAATEIKWAQRQVL